MNIHKILANWVVFAGFIVIPCIPFIVMGKSTFFPYIVGKNFAFRVIVEVMFSAWLVLVYIDPAYRPKKSYLLGAFGTLLFVVTLSAIFGENPTKSFWSNFERMEGVVTYFHLFAYFVVASTVLTVRNLWRSFLQFNLGVSLIMGIYALSQISGQAVGFRASGTLGNSSYLGIYAFFNIFLAVFFIGGENINTYKWKIRAITYALIAILQTYVLYHTGTRGAILGLIVAVGISAILVAIFEKEKKAFRVWAIGGLITLVALVGIFVSVRNTSFVKETPLLARFSEISISTLPTNARFMIWNMAYQGFREHPLLGWGMENFNYVFNKYYDPNMWGQEQWFDRAHNVFFDWLIAGGIFALLAYLSLFGFAVYYIWRPTTLLSVLEKSILTGLLGGYFFQNLFVFDNLTSLIYFGTILAYVESLRQRDQAPEKKLVKKGKSKEEDFTVIVSGGAILLACVLVYTVNYNGFMQNTTLIRAMSDRSGAENNLALFKQAIAYNSFGTAEAREQLGQISTDGFGHSGTVSDIQKQFIVLAANELGKQAAELPRDARYQIFEGSFLVRVGAIDQGIGYINRAIELSPKKQSMYFELGNAYYRKKDLVKAEEAFKHAYELAPAYAEAKKYYIEILTTEGKTAEEKKVSEE